MNKNSSVEQYVGTKSCEETIKVSRFFKRKTKAVKYHITFGGITQTLSLEFKAKRKEADEYPSKMMFSFNEKTEKWSADFIEEYS